MMMHQSNRILSCNNLFDFEVIRYLIIQVPFGIKAGLVAHRQLNGTYTEDTSMIRHHLMRRAPIVVEVGPEAEEGLLLILNICQKLPVIRFHPEMHRKSRICPIQQFQRELHTTLTQNNFFACLKNATRFNH